MWGMQILQEQISVHADGDAMVLQQASQAIAGKLRALVGIKNLRHPIILDGTGQAVDTETGIHGVG
jgi:hypothetical protein